MSEAVWKWIESFPADKVRHRIEILTHEKRAAELELSVLQRELELREEEPSGE